MKKFTLFVSLFIAFSTVLKAQDPVFTFLGLTAGSVNKDLGDITISCTHVFDAVSGGSSATITNLDTGDETALEYMPIGGATNRMGCFYLPGWSKITEFGTYMLTIPEGYFVITTDAGEVYSKEIVLTPLIVGELEPLAFKSASPADGSTVQILDKIVLTFNRGIMPPNLLTFPDALTVVDKDKNVISTAAVEMPDGGNVAYDAPVVLANPITTAGDYYITIPAGYIPDALGSDEKHAEISLHFVVDGTYVDTAIDDVQAEDGEAVVFDMLGRRVENVTAPGIYIVNGKKTIIK